MSKTKIDSPVVSKIIAALYEHDRIRKATPEDNPFDGRPLKDMVQNAGILKSADKHPAKSMAPENPVGYDMEAARFEALEAEKVDKSQQRKAVARQRQARKMNFDDLANSSVTPPQERMQEAWYVVFPLVTTVSKIAEDKKRWAGRFLGSVTDDISQMALEKMALVLARSDRDLTLLRAAAEEIGEQQKRSKSIPGDQMTKEERKERKQMAKARKWLMGMAHNRVMGALTDVYTSQKNLRWDNLDIITTVMANVNSAGDDPLTARFKADRAPAFMGTRFPSPGVMPAEVLAVSISAGITNRELDPIVEIILNDDNRRADGAIKWAQCAEMFFRATPGGLGDHMWDCVVKATEHHTVPSRARADAARMHVRNLFEWLPRLIVATVEAYEPSIVVGYDRGRTLLASQFELHYLCYYPESEARTLGVPGMKFASKKEAAEVLAEYLSHLVTGEDVVSSIVNA